MGGSALWNALMRHWGPLLWLLKQKCLCLIWDLGKAAHLYKWEPNIHVLLDLVPSPSPSGFYIRKWMSWSFSNNACHYSRSLLAFLADSIIYSNIMLVKIVPPEPVIDVLCINNIWGCPPPFLVAPGVGLDIIFSHNIMDPWYLGLQYAHACDMVQCFAGSYW